MRRYCELRVGGPTPNTALLLEGISGLYVTIRGVAQELQSAASTTPSWADMQLITHPFGLPRKRGVMPDVLRYQRKLAEWLGSYTERRRGTLF